MQEKCSYDESKAGWEKEVEALWQRGKVQGDGQHCTTGGGPFVEARGDGEEGVGREGGGEAAARAMR